MMGTPLRNDPALSVVADSTGLRLASDGTVDSLPWHWIGLGSALLVFAAAGLGYWQATSPPAQTAPRLQAAGAGLAELLRPARTKKNDLEPAGSISPARATQQAPAWPLWEFRLREPIPPRDPPLTPPPWRLIGASGTAGKWQLIVLREGKSDPEYFRVGQQLPGNYRIEAITEEDVTLRHGRREMVLSYFASR